jgi:hypothetical protein
LRAASARQVNIIEITAQLARQPQRVQAPDQFIATGLPGVNNLLGGIPCGCITEVIGEQSSGKTSLLLSTLATATNNDETCALVDTTDCFDVASAVAAKSDLGKLLWIRCAGNVEHAFKTVDLLLHGGGFGLIALDLSDVPASYTNRIVSSWWYRFRHTLENTRTAFMVIGQTPCARSAATFVLELKKDASVWSTTANYLSQQTLPRPPVSNLLSAYELRVERRKPIFNSQSKAQLATQLFYRAS